MCYEETFFQRWARRRAQQRQESKPVIERATPTTQPSQPAQPAPAGKKKEVKQADRELEVV